MIKEGLKKLNEKKILEALIIFKDLEKLNPENKDIQFCLGNIYYELNDLTRSLNYYEKSFKHYSNSEAVINNYGIALQSIGEINKAEKLFSKLIEMNPNDIKSYYRLHRMGIKDFGKKYLEKLKYIEKNNNLNHQAKSLIYFIFSKNEKNKKNIKSEIEFLHLAHQNHFKSNQEYNSKLLNFYNNFLFNYFNKIDYKKISKNLKYEEQIKPIFIIGLPRSGSTLVESLISIKNKSFYSYGETSIFDIAIRNQIKDKSFNLKSKIEIDENLLISFLNNIYNYTQDKNFVDKSLENFFYIDIILKVFPKAKFIHTFRNKFDALVGIYQSMLIYLPWAHSIENIIKYIENYEQVISYFKKKYPNKILDINLENFVLDPKDYSKKIYNFCDLKWSESVLQFYKSKNLTSKSSSFLQIRKQINKYNSKKYKPYYFLFKNKKFK
ncbi:sulfotransferase [Candidatus Pelagibacter sp.]|nr:sulfotransferase [Candidatus Pelagibacter sp.]